jgi:hypothetical protein
VNQSDKRGTILKFFLITVGKRNLLEGEYATLQIFAPRATKKFIEEKVAIKLGKVHVQSLLTAKRLKNLRFLDSKVLLQHDKDGWSILDDFENDTIYKLRYEPDDGFDESIGFSDAKLENVEKHFNLLITQDWLPEDDYTHYTIPDSLFDQLLLLYKRNTLFSENARRTIISLFLVNAVELADEDNKLHIHEEMDFSCVREADGVRIQYKGPVDFAVGHSPVDSKLKKDCTLLVVEAKTVAKLGDALGQTLAQAATNFIIRKLRKDLTGFLKVYWCISDGESWRFGYITEEIGSKLIVCQSNAITCWLHQPQIQPDKQLCSKLFSKITHWIKKAMDSSKTTSRRTSQTHEDSSGIDELNEVFISASIN